MTQVAHNCDDDDKMARPEVGEVGGNEGAGADNNDPMLISFHMIVQ